MEDILANVSDTDEEKSSVEGLKRYNAMAAVIETHKTLMNSDGNFLEFSELPALYLNEERTIAVKGRRQFGKTHWIVNHARRGDVVLVTRSEAAREYQTLLRTLKVPETDYPEILTKRALENWTTRDLKIKNIFIDDASYFFFDKEERNNFYFTIMGSCTKDTLIYMLG